MNAADMINRCFRHQHPEAYGRAENPEAAVPQELRYGGGDSYEITSGLPEPPMGDPNHVPLV